MSIFGTIGKFLSSPGGKVAGNLASGLIGAYGANKAAGKQTDSANAAITNYNQQYQDTRNNLAPWLASGRNALGQLQNPIQSFYASPDYEFRRTEGTRGIERSAAARGGAFSGNALKALNEYNSNLASGEFGNWFNRTSDLANRGQQAAVDQGAFGASNANSVGNALMDAGDARASGVAGVTNNITKGLSDAADIYDYFGSGSAAVGGSLPGTVGLSSGGGGGSIAGTLGDVGTWGGSSGAGTIGAFDAGPAWSSGLGSTAAGSSPYSLSAMGPGLAAGAAAFGLAKLGNNWLGNNDPYVLNDGVNYDADTGRASSGNFSAYFTPDKGLMSNTNGTAYQDASGRTYEIPLLNGRTGNNPVMIYQYLQKQGAQLPDYATFLAEYQALGAHQ